MRSICALTGERDLAFQQLEVLAKIPAGATYGDLCLNPYWDPLRGDPRFDKIVRVARTLSQARDINMPA